MPSAFMKVSSNEAVRAAINAVVAALVVGLYGIVTTDGFDLFQADWGSILKSSLNWAVAAFVGSLGRKFLSTEDGKFLGRIG